MMSNLCFLMVILIATQICTSTLTTPSTDLPAHEGENKLRIVCYYYLDTYNASDSRDYSDDVIDENLCTHIVFTDTLTVTDTSIDESFDEGKRKVYDRIVDFRKKGVHVSIMFEGFNLHDHSRLVDVADHANVVKLIVQFMEKYNFDGFEAFWNGEFCTDELPYVCFVLEDRISNLFMRRLSEAFKPRGWLLSATVITNKTGIEAGFDIQKISDYVDWITVLVLDPSENTALSAPLYFYQGDTSDEINANWSINYLIGKGVPSHKLVLPVTSVGTTFPLISATENGLNALASDNLSFDKFYETCDKIKKGNWSVEHDAFRVGSYAYLDDQWTSYVDVGDVYHKAKYILEMNLSGGAIYNVNGDDFENKCDCGK